MKPNDYLINCYTSNGNRFNITCQQQTVHHHNIMYSVKLLCLHTFKGMYRNRNFKMKDVILILIGTESKTLAYKGLEKTFLADLTLEIQIGNGIVTNCMFLVCKSLLCPYLN